MALLTPSFLPSQTYPFGPAASKTGLRFLFEQLDQQEGVVASPATALKVSQRAAGGAGMFVDVAAGGAWVRGDDTARQGYYHGYNDAVVTLAVAANASGNPRIDQVILRVYDSSIAGALDALTLEVLTGTPTVGATIDNRLGAVALPNGAVRLGEFPVASGAVSILDAVIRDRRPYSRGFNYSTERSGTDLNFPAAGGGFANIDNNYFQRRVECSGAPLEAFFLGQALQAAAVAGLLQVRLSLDGVSVKEGRVTIPALANFYAELACSWRTVPTPGTHLLTMAFAQATGMSAQLLGAGVNTANFGIAERVAGNVDNGLT